MSTGVATPEAVVLEYGATKVNQVASRSSVQGSLGLYDPHLSAASHKLSSATGAESSGYEGISGQEKVPFVNGTIPIERREIPISMPGDDPGGSDKSGRPQAMSASDHGKRPGLTRGRSQSQSGSSRRPGGRQTVQAQSTQHYHQSPPPNTQESTHNIPGAPVGFQGPSPQYQASTTSPYDQRANYGGQYTMPPQSPMGMAHTPPQFPYTHAFHPGSLHSPPDPNMLSPTVHPGFQQMLQPRGPVYPYQRHSPENPSPPHSFPGGYPHSQVTPSPPPLSPMSAQSSGSPAVPHSASFGQFPPLQFSGTPSLTQYPPYTSRLFPTSPSMYQAQYVPPPYPPNYISPTSDQEGQGTWWYLPHGAPPPPHPFESIQPPYQAHYPMGYSHLGRREGEAPYSPPGPSPSTSTPPTMYQVASARSAAQQGTRSEQAVSSSSSPAAHERSSPMATSQAEHSVSPTTMSKPAAERVVIRRSYHPNPPAQRSEWVMWAGNVPSDTVHDELWRFFKQPPASPVQGPSDKTDDPLYDGVSSIFLIARSNCAFVNFDSEGHLHSAIERFNGKSLRPNDSRCPRLVCRVRRKDDDLKAGVGGQRGMGIHTSWIKEKGSMVPADDTATSSTSEATSSPPAEQLGPLMTAMSLSSDEDRYTARTKQSSSGSYASTNSSILTRYFPKRYFILKSLTQFDLDLSVEKGLWATQKHNEGILDQAYRTSTEVYLIFGVNKSGEFYGYARMAGPVLQGEHQVSWASRNTDSTSSSRSSLSPIAGRGSRPSEEAASPSRLLRRVDQPNFFSPVENRLVEESPMPLKTPDMKQTSLEKQAEVLPVAQQNRPSAPDGRALQSAPAELGPARRKFTRDTPRAKQSLGTGLMFNGPAATEFVSSGDQNLPDGFKLDPDAPIRAQRNNNEDELPGERPPSLHVVAEESGKPDDQVENVDEVPKPDGTPREGWGESFKIEWLCTDRLPFYRTRHLRNPWNHDREIKVSRDGTELEPSVGQKLLDDWASLAAEPATDVDRGATGAQKRPPGVAASAPVSVLSVPLARDSSGGKGAARRT